MIGPMSLGTGIIGGSPAEIVWRATMRNTADDPPWDFNGISIGDADASRYLLLFCEPSNLTVTVNDNAATQINSSYPAWFLIHQPTGTSANVRINGSSTAVSGTLLMWSLHRLRSTTPIAYALVAYSSTNPKSTTIQVKKGGVVAAVGAGGALGVTSGSYAFGGGLVTDAAGVTADATCIGAGHGNPTETNAAWGISVNRTSGSFNFSLNAISFR